MNSSIATLVILATSLAACADAASSIPDASPRADAPIVQPIDAPVARVGLVLNEVAASGTPDDWFEVTNTGVTSIVLSDYCFVDIKADFVKCKPFAATVLAPGAYIAVDVTDATAGFKLASDEELWIYRNADHVLIDGVDWAEGQSPSGGSFARSPDATGAFAVAVTATRAAKN